MIDCTAFIQINIVGYFTAEKKTTVYKKYKGRANIVVDMVKGTASLELNSATSADTRDYECKVQDSEDEEGRLSDKASLVVLGKRPFWEMLVNISGPISSVINTQINTCDLCWKNELFLFSHSPRPSKWSMNQKKNELFLFESWKVYKVSFEIFFFLNNISF